MDLFYEVNTFKISKDGEFSMMLIPDRLRGDMAAFDIKVGKKTLVEQGRRITARHIRQLEEAKIKELDVPAEYLFGRALAKDILIRTLVKLFLNVIQK